MIRTFLIAIVLLAGCMTSEAPKPNSVDPDIQAVLGRLDKLESAVAELQDEPPPQPEPEPEPRPDLDGFSERTREGWRRYAVNYADALATVIEGMDSGKYDTIEKAVAAIKSGSISSRHRAMDPVVNEFEGLEFDGYRDKLREYEKGIRWHARER